MNEKSKSQEIRKCIACVYAVWPQTASGFCMVYNIGTMEAREPSGPCGPDGHNFLAKNSD